MNERATDWEPINEASLGHFMRIVAVLERTRDPLETLISPECEDQFLETLGPRASDDLLRRQLFQYHDQLVLGPKLETIRPWWHVWSPITRRSIRRNRTGKLFVYERDLRSEPLEAPVAGVADSDFRGLVGHTLAGIAEKFTSWREQWDRDRWPEQIFKDRFDNDRDSDRKLQFLLNTLRSLEPEIGDMTVEADPGASDASSIRNDRYRAATLLIRIPFAEPRKSQWGAKTHGAIDVCPDLFSKYTYRQSVESQCKEFTSVESVIRLIRAGQYDHAVLSYDGTWELRSGWLTKARIDEGGKLIEV